MRTLYLDCGMGAAGDMLTAALLELVPEKDKFVEKLNALGIPGVCYKAEMSEKCGIRGTHVSVTVNGEEEEADGHHHHHDHDHEHHHDHDHEHHHEHDHEHHHEHDHEHHHDHEHGHHHHHSGLHDIEHIIGDLPVSEKVKSDALAVYGLIAEAESHAHGVPVTEIHFHEVGTMDAVADVVAVCMLMEELGCDKICASSVHVGAGHVHCAHGILPVPAPATAYILQGVPVYGGGIKSELCTPTGAALLKHFVTSFGDMPAMTLEKVGYGMGKKDFTAANCVRALLGTAEGDSETAYEISCNVDDMTGEDISYACEMLYAAGAVEVYTMAIGMKKGRPGTLIRAICDDDCRIAVVEAFMKHTSTIGVRETATKRYKLHRCVETAATALGSVRYKTSSGYGAEKSKPEFEDIKRIAQETGMSLAEVRSTIEAPV